MAGNQYTQKSMEAIQLAQRLAAERGHQQLEQAHLLLALLSPDMTGLQDENRWSEILVRSEEEKTMPFGEVWEDYCRRCEVPGDGAWFDAVQQYEADVLVNRG